MVETVVVVAVLVAAFVLPVPAVAAVLGFLLPVDYVGVIDPGVLDAARYLVAGVLILRCRPTPVESQRGAAAILGTALLLGLVGLLTMAKGIGSDADGLLLTGATIVVSVAVAYLLARRRQIYAPVLGGFVAGNAVSAVDILLQYAGMPFIGMPSQWGDRFSGFSHASTTAAPQFAVCILVLVGLVVTRRASGRIKPMSAVFLLGVSGILAVALVLTNGRGGIVGLAAGLAVLLARGIRRGRLAAALVAVAGLVVAFEQRDALISYFVRDRAVDFTSGRVVRNADAFEALMDAPLLGPAPDVVAGLHPHTPVLLFGLFAGVVGVVVILVVLARLVRITVRGVWSPDVHVVVLAMVSAVIVVTSFLEPDGFFIGLAPVVVLFMVVVAAETGATTSSAGRSRPPAAGADAGAVTVGSR